MNKKKQRYGNPANRKPVVGDLQKLIQPTGLGNPRKLGGSIVDPLNDPRARGNAFLDLTDAVLLEESNVCTVDMVRSGELNEQAIFLTLAGRINKKTDRVNVGFVFGPDGAAALITELLSLADRFGAELLLDMTSRLINLHQNKNVDLHFLKAAIDLALEENET